MDSVHGSMDEDAGLYLSHNETDEIKHWQKQDQIFFQTYSLKDSGQMLFHVQIMMKPKTFIV